MKLKDKIKAVAIAAFTTVLTSCGFSGDKKELKVRERHDDNKEAMSLPRSPKVAFTSRWGNYTSDPISRDSSATEILTQLKKDKIPVIKGDSVLHDVFLTDKGNGELQLSDPHYALNKVEKDVYPDNTKHLDNGFEIRKKRDANDVQHKTFEVDEKTIGIAFFQDETRKERISRVRKLVEDKNAEKELQKGDTVVVPGFGSLGDEKFVVEKDGVSPTKETSSVNTTSGCRVEFDYKLKDR